MTKRRGEIFLHASVARIEQRAAGGGGGGSGGDGGGGDERSKIA